MVEKQFYVYMLASKRNGTLYLGVTSDIVKRVWQHKNGLAEGFTKKYGINFVNSDSKGQYNIDCISLAKWRAISLSILLSFDAPSFQ